MATLIEAILAFEWAFHESDQCCDTVPIYANAMATDAKESLSV